MASLMTMEYVPHYRVCRKIAVRRVPTVASCPEEVFYELKDLKCLVARFIGQNMNLSKSSTIQDLQALVEQENGVDNWKHFLTKERCPDVKFKVGLFHLHPDFRDKVQPNMFSVDLIQQSRGVLLFLNDVNLRLTKFLVSQVGVSKCVEHRYAAYLELVRDEIAQFNKDSKGKKNATFQSRILPPLDVAAVHFSHMLQSEDWAIFSRSQGVEELNHVCTWLYQVEDLSEWRHLEDQSRDLWKKKCPRDDYGVEMGWVQYRKQQLVRFEVFQLGQVQLRGLDAGRPVCGVDADDPRVQSGTTTYSYLGNDDVTPQTIPLEQVGVIPSVRNWEEARKRLYGIVKDDHSWFQNFLLAHRGRVQFSGDELAEFLIFYQKYLYLLAKYPQRMEWIGFSPSPSVDLMWHTHLLSPQRYERDLKLLMGGVPHHKLLPGSARTAFVYEKHQNSESELWDQEFHETMIEERNAPKPPKSTLPVPVPRFGK